jgi:hypothetical protein
MDKSDKPDTEMEACCLCGGECSRQVFTGDHIIGEAVLWMCAKSVRLGGTCRADALWSQDEWNLVNRRTPATPTDVGELVERQSAAKNELQGWRVHDGHFFDWLSEHMGPENVAYLRLLVETAGNVELLREGATQLSAMAEERDRLREALTPSGATKHAYIGEFSWTEDLDYDGACQGRKLTVPWTTTKEIMAAILKRALGTPATAEGDRE